MLCGRGGENLKTESFQWHLANHHEDNCLLHGEMVWLDAISEKSHFKTHIHHWYPHADYVGKLQTDEHLSLTLV